MNDIEKLEYFLDAVKLAYSDESAKQVEIFFKIYKLFKELLKEILKDEKQYFSGDFPRLLFIIDKYSIASELANSLKSLRYLAAKNRNASKAYSIGQNEINLLAKSIIELLVKLWGETDDPFAATIRNCATKTIPYQTKEVDSKDLENVLVKEKIVEEIGDTNVFTVICQDAEENSYRIIFSKEWEFVYHSCEINTELNFFEMEFLEESAAYIFTTKSICVLYPDYLMDATELASCFSGSDYNYYNYFVSLFSTQDFTPKLFSGNVVNFFFDELVLNSNVEYEELYEKALKSKPLQLFAISSAMPDLLKIELRNLPTQFENLKSGAKELDLSKASIEPSFISGKYGLQGRLDLMLESAENDNKKDVIELKSGKAPSTNYSVSIGRNKQKAPIGMWYNHLAQVVCYNMLLDSAYENRSGSSSILYSALAKDALRNAPNYFYTKKQIMALRDQIICELMSLAENNTEIIDKLLFAEIDDWASYTKEKILKFRRVYLNASETQRKYFLGYASFIQREIMSSKIGDSRDSNSGFSALWKESPQEKEGSYSIITHLSLNEKKSDFKVYHLYFDRSQDYSLAASFRKGDIVVLYPYKLGGKGPTQSQIIKCAIKEIDSEYLIITLRNKLFPIEIFQQEYEYWAIEPDQNESNNKRLFSNISDFLAAPDRKRKLLCGEILPEHDEEYQEILSDRLNENQNEILNKALKAKDYFLIQGPPGTGKTSYMLSEIIKYKILNTKENILLTAYTNRAVDEICETLLRLGDGFDFIRLGSKESSVHQDRLLCNLAERDDIRELFLKAKNIRIVVATVSSLIGNGETFYLKDFHTLIIDEAAQILEPYIVGLVSRIPKFIMIGDEKQLPAIVCQSEQFLKVEDEDLQAIGLNKLSDSLFERLLKLNQNNGASQNYGILKKQARMHEQIQKFPNDKFYGGELEILEQNSWQTSKLDILDDIDANSKLAFLKHHRLIFINSRDERSSKINKSEAAIAKAIIEFYKEKAPKAFNANFIGAISPFRAQCVEIANSLDFHLRESVSVDTVERFQGSERRVIIYSFATNFQMLLNNISSLSEINGSTIDRKLNVALTRAKEQIIIIGREAILRKNPLYSELIDFIASEGIVLDYRDIIDDEL
jgi:DNA replication ATP-dependent helicase Dna2